MYYNLSLRPTKFQGLLWLDLLGTVRRHYNGQRYRRHRLRLHQLWRSTSSLQLFRSRRAYRQRRSKTKKSTHKMRV